jgi:hypothetical protein
MQVLRRRWKCLSTGVTGQNTGSSVEEFILRIWPGCGVLSSPTSWRSTVHVSRWPRKKHSRHSWAPLFQEDWVVYAKPPFGGPEHVLHYLALRIAWAPDES